MMRPARSILLLVLIMAGASVTYSFLHPVPAFLPPGIRHVPQPTRHQRQPPPPQPTSTTPANPSPTALFVLLDVPDGFFTFTFPMLGILLSIAKNFGRVRLEERAWEQRLEEARLERLKQDPTVTELDLRRQEAALEWSAYGKPAAEAARRRERQTEQSAQPVGRRPRGQVMEDTKDDTVTDPRKYRMTEQEIEAFELEYGVEYDPYYDDPYPEEELPEGKYNVDRLYGDRIYDNGEIFYKDAKTNLYYRQGCKPRNLSFWA